MDDLPREAVQRMEVCARHGSLLELVAAKDRIILQLLKEREEYAHTRDALARG